MARLDKIGLRAADRVERARAKTCSRKILRITPDRARAEAITTAWNHIHALPAPA